MYPKNSLAKGNKLKRFPEEHFVKQCEPYFAASYLLLTRCLSLSDDFWKIMAKRRKLVTW